MRHGYTVVWCGWQHDAPEVAGLLSMQVPNAITAEGPVSGRLMVTFQPNAPTDVQILSDRMHRPYPAMDTEEAGAVLTVQDSEYSSPQTISRDRWSFAKTKGGSPVPDSGHIYLREGFQPGKVYRVIYNTNQAPIVGLGLLATRDLVSFLRYSSAGQGNPCLEQIDYAFAFGASQSGRFLRHLLYLGLNQDEDDRRVFDGVIAHIAGGRRGEFNQRFGQPSCVVEHSVGSLFPFADIDLTEPETERVDGLLSKLASRRRVPKVFLTNTSAEYWGGHAALSHTNTSATADIDPSDSVRIYHYSGTQHGSGTFPLADNDAATGNKGQHLFNCVEYAPLLRAALVSLDRWVSNGEPPPPSRHPRIADGTAVPPDQIASTFNAIPGVEFPEQLRYLVRLDFGPDAKIPEKLPPAAGRPYPVLVPVVDQDGNEAAGIRLPDVSVPVATHTGWNLRHPDIGGAGQLLRMLGSSIPFPLTRSEREATSDPRLSIEERYINRDAYQERLEQAALELVAEGYLLEADVDTVVTQGLERYDIFAKSEARQEQAADD
jgi:hypothetical protein